MRPKTKTYRVCDDLDLGLTRIIKPLLEQFPLFTLSRSNSQIRTVPNFLLHTFDLLLREERLSWKEGECRMSRGEYPFSLIAVLDDDKRDVNE